jgi:hypothetical protein
MAARWGFSIRACHEAANHCFLKSYHPDIAGRPVKADSYPNYVDAQIREQPFDFSITEWLAVLSSLYILCIATFAAGYFDRVPGRFIELFSFSDLIGSNIPVLQFFLSLFFTYCFVSFSIGWLVAPRWRRIKGKVEETLSFTLTDKVAIYAAMFFLVSLSLLSSIISDVPEAPLWARVAPSVIGQGLWTYMWWVGYKNDRVTRSSLAIVVILGIVVSSHTIGRSWFDYDVSSSNGVQSMFMAGGICLERKILLRPKDEIRVVYQDRCGGGH